MTTTRVSANQLSTPLPLEDAREAIRQAMVQAGLKQVYMDPRRPRLSACTADSSPRKVQDVEIFFESRSGSTFISIRSTPQMPGALDFGRSKRHAKQLADDLEQALAAA